MDDVGLVVEGDDSGPAGQVEAVYLFLDLLDDLVAVRAAQGDDHAGDGFACGVVEDRALPKQRQGFELGHLLDQHRRAVRGSDDGVAQIFERCGAAEPAHGIGLVGVLDVGAAEVGVVALDRHDDFVQGQVVAAQRVGVDEDGVLLDFPSPGVDFGDLGDGGEFVANGPVEQRLELHERKSGGLDGELVDLAESGGHRPHDGGDAGRHGALDLVEPLGDELAGAVQVDRVVEDDGQEGDLELGGGADDLEVRHAEEGGLEWKGDQLFDLDGAHAGGLGGDHDLIVGEIGEGLERDPREDQRAAREQQEHGDEDEPAVGEDEIEDGLHERAGSLVMVRR